MSAAMWQPLQELCGKRHLISLWMGSVVVTHLDRRRSFHPLHKCLSQKSGIFLLQLGPQQEVYILLYFLFQGPKLICLNLCLLLLYLPEGVGSKAVLVAKNRDVLSTGNEWPWVEEGRQPVCYCWEHQPWGMVKFAKHISFYSLLLPERLVASLPSLSRRGSGAITGMESIFHALTYISWLPRADYLPSSCLANSSWTSLLKVSRDGGSP